ncbi:FAD-dependent thymidylate synthase [Candidatus Microgenomates bacterium]|nr:FAD-dependent thymidylate synthase [Candidatus Microgenomates bacterium]
MHKTADLRVDFLGITPVFKEEDFFLNPEQIVAFSALLTFKGKPIKELYQQALEKDQDIDKKVKNILRKSSLRGHSSIATTPHLCVTFQGSKFLDLMFTGINFSSSLMASGRRTAMEPDDIVIPSTIEKSSFKNLYFSQSEENIKFFNEMIEQNVLRDVASKAVQYGIFGTGILDLPLESVINIKKEIETEGEWMPEEAKMFLKTIEEKLAEYGALDLYQMRAVAPRDAFPYPHVFKNPNNSNLTRELRQQTPGIDSVISSAVIQPTEGLREGLRQLSERTKKMAASKDLIIREWYELLNLRRRICRDYNLAVDLQILSSGTWRSYTDKKRHRTCYLISESIYWAVEKAAEVFDKIEISEKLTDADLKKIDEVYYIPPSIESNKELLLKWLKEGKASILAYKKMVGGGVKSSDAIFIIPRAIRIDMLQKFDLYNLISGYFPLRLCSTADELLQRTTEKEAFIIRKLLKEKLPELAEEIKVKCHLCAFCPEEKFCGKIRAMVPNYDEEFHQKMKSNLEERYLASNK